MHDPKLGPGLVISAPLQGLRPVPGHRPSYGTADTLSLKEGMECDKLLGNTTVGLK